MSRCPTTDSIRHRRIDAELKIGTTKRELVRLTQINQSGRDSGIRLDGCSRAARTTGRLLIERHTEKVLQLAALDPEVVADQYIEYADRLRPHVLIPLKIYDAIQRRRCLKERERF